MCSCRIDTLSFYNAPFISDDFSCSEVCFFLINIATPAVFFFISFSVVCLSPPFTFNLSVFLYLKWVSYSRHKVGPCIFSPLTISLLYLVSFFYLDYLHVLLLLI